MARAKTRARALARKHDRQCFCTGVNEASMDEPAAAELYKKLMENAPDDAARKLIASIRADEIMHKRMFKAIKDRISC